MSKNTITIRNSSILITGGTGSFGRTVAKHLLTLGAKDIVIYSRDEEKQWRMKHVDGFKDFRYIIGDVRDPDKLKSAAKNMDVIFHAAALKQVPSCEAFPEEALKTNAIGSMNVCRVAIEMSVKKVVALSTDKAVNPINAMGITKALMEKIVCSQNYRDCETIFCCTRYGNVIGSRGSVIPLFINKIKSGQPITITDPKMTRFMMSLDDSVDLVMHAIENSEGGEIFVKKSPATTVEFLASTLLDHYQGNTQIEIIGTRPGEKTHETLVNEYEYRRSIEQDNYFIVSPEYRVFETNKVGEYRSDNTKMICDKAALMELLFKSGAIL